MVGNQLTVSQEIQQSTTKSNEWTEERKNRLAQLDEEERVKGKGFMQRLKERWDLKYPGTRFTKQNLRDNANMFRKELGQKSKEHKSKESTTWTNEMKIRVVELDEKARKQGRGFMQRLKDWWVQEFHEHREMSAQCLGDNARRFDQDKTISNMLLIKQGKERLKS